MDNVALDTSLGKSIALEKLWSIDSIPFCDIVCLIWKEKKSRQTYKVSGSHLKKYYHIIQNTNPNMKIKIIIKQLIFTKVNQLSP